jgi:hypothetical protein
MQLRTAMRAPNAVRGSGGVAIVLSLAALFSVALALAQPAAPVAIHHIHGLAVDPREPEALLVATHTGLVRLRSKAPPEWVGEQRFDLMGFTAPPTGIDVMYASGHPDMPTYRREKVGNLGLLLSEDGGRTWRSVTLAGHVDFHALTWSPRDRGQLYGWSVTGQVGLHRVAVKTWKSERLEANGLSNVLALSASREATGTLLAGTTEGLKISIDGGATWRPAAAAAQGGAVTAVAHHGLEPRLVYAYVNRRDAGLLRSRDGGGTWEPTGFFSGTDAPVVAVAVGPDDHVAVATTAGDIERSRDGGRTWRKVLVTGRPVADEGGR